MMICSTNK